VYRVAQHWSLTLFWVTLYARGYWRDFRAHHVKEEENWDFFEWLNVSVGGKLAEILTFQVFPLFLFTLYATGHQDKFGALHVEEEEIWNFLSGFSFLYLENWLRYWQSKFFWGTFWVSNLQNGFSGISPKLPDLGKKCKEWELPRKP